jgi:hypothetical protein
MLKLVLTPHDPAAEAALAQAVTAYLRRFPQLRAVLLVNGDEQEVQLDTPPDVSPLSAWQLSSGRKENELLIVHKTRR